MVLIMDTFIGFTPNNVLKAENGFCCLTLFKSVVGKQLVKG